MGIITQIHTIIFCGQEHGISYSFGGETMGVWKEEENINR